MGSGADPALADAARGSGYGSRSVSTSSTPRAPPSTTRSFTSPPTGPWPAATANSWPPAGNGSSGAWATAPPSPRSRPRSAASAVSSAGRTTCRSARAALYAQGIDIHLAPTWDNSDVWVPTMRHIAKEGRMYVVGVTSCLRGADLPPDIPGREELYGDPDDWLSRGNTVIVGPDGDVLAGAAHRRNGHPLRRRRRQPSPGQPPPIRPRRSLQPQRRIQTDREHGAAAPPPASNPPTRRHSAQRSR